MLEVTSAILGVLVHPAAIRAPQVRSIPQQTSIPENPGLTMAPSRFLGSLFARFQNSWSFYRASPQLSRNRNLITCSERIAQSGGSVANSHWCAQLLSEKLTTAEHQPCFTFLCLFPYIRGFNTVCVYGQSTSHLFAGR